MTLATVARIWMDPQAILHRKEAHDLAHAFVRAKKAMEDIAPFPRSRSRGYGGRRTLSR